MKTIKISEKHWKTLKDLYYINRLQNIDETIEILLEIAAKNGLLGTEDYDQSKK